MVRRSHSLTPAKVSQGMEVDEAHLQRISLRQVFTVAMVERKFVSSENFWHGGRCRILRWRKKWKGPQILNRFSKS